MTAKARNTIAGRNPDNLFRLKDLHIRTGQIHYSFVIYVPVGLWKNLHARKSLFIYVHIVLLVVHLNLVINAYIRLNMGYVIQFSDYSRQISSFKSVYIQGVPKSSHTSRQKEKF